MPSDLWGQRSRYMISLGLDCYCYLSFHIYQAVWYHHSQSPMCWICVQLALVSIFAQMCKYPLYYLPDRQEGLLSALGPCKTLAPVSHVLSGQAPTWGRHGGQCSSLQHRRRSHTPVIAFPLSLLQHYQFLLSIHWLSGRKPLVGD